jgi:hypothetical protein
MTSVRAASLLGFLAIASAPLAGCDAPPRCQPSAWVACDIRRRLCQLDVFEAVQCGRGVSIGGLPPIRTIDTATFREELEMDAATLEPKPHWDATFQLLDILASGTSIIDSSIESRVGSTLAFYDTGSGGITIIDRGAPADLTMSSAVLAHELVHALQDRQFPLDEYLEGAVTFDEVVARRAVIEGEATLGQNQYSIRQQGHTAGEVDWARYYDESLTRAREGVALAPSRWFEARLVSMYLLGARRITAAWLPSMQGAAIESFFTSPPTSIVPFMADPFAGEAPSVPQAVPCAPPEPPSGLELVTDDALGPTLLFAFLAADPATTETAWALARDLRGDRIRIVGDEARTAFEWRILVPGNARRLAEAPVMAAWGAVPGHRVIADGEYVVLVASDDPTLASSWTAAGAACVL